MANILVVDDSLVIRQMMSSTLENTDHEIVVANDGQEALSLFREMEFHLVITDINMPVMNGLELASKIRSGDKNSQVPLIVLSTEFSDEIKEEGKNLGINAWLVKPFNEDKLIDVIDHFLKEK